MINTGNLWFFTLLVAGFWACGDDAEVLNQEITSEDISNVTSVDDATLRFADAITIANQILADQEVLNGRIQQCYSVSDTQIGNQLLVTFETDCIGLDGRERTGRFLIDWSGELGTGDFAYTLTFDGYEVNGYGLSGSITASKLTFKENGFIINVTVNDGIVNCPDGKQINYEQDFDYDFTLGEITEVRITGSSSGMGKEGVSYIANIKEPLLIVADCEHVVSGSFEVTFNGRPVVTVDYGNGACDNTATAIRGPYSIIFGLS